MTDTIIPVTYAGGIAYSLILHNGPNGLRVRRSSGGDWKDVVDIKGSQLDEERVLVEINGDLKHGAPIFAWMRPEDWETVKRLRG